LDRPLRLPFGLSPCPNDTFAFWAALHGEVLRRAVALEPAFGDIETLNERALGADPLPVTKLDPARFARLADDYAALVARRGVPPDSARQRLFTRPSVAAAMLLKDGTADAAIIGCTGAWMTHFGHARDIIGMRPGVGRISALSCLVLPWGNIFVADTYVNVDPGAGQIVEMTLLAADAVRRFGVVPQVALVSHSNFGGSGAPSARKMRQALAMLRAQAPDLAVDGEMHGDAALSEVVRARVVQDSRLEGAANLLVMPNLDAANITFTTLRAAADGLEVGPMLLGMAKPIHVLTNTITARGIMNVTALAVTECAAAG